MGTQNNDTSTTNIILQYTNEDYKVFPNGPGKGLENVGNTCYMNSAFQSFLRVKPLSAWLMKGDYKEDLNSAKTEKFLVQAWKMLVENYYNNDNTKVINPSACHNIINHLANSKQIPLYQLGNQNDIQEFILFFINSLHEALCYPIKATIRGTMKSPLDRLTLDAHKQWATMYRQDYSSIVELFHGQFISITTCPDCSNQTQKFDPECCFQLPIPPKKKGKPVDLIDCWRKFTELETMDNKNMYNCEKCKEMKNATKQIALWKTPQILIILLKRFRSHGAHATKINDLVTFPTTLDLTEFCTSYDKLQSTYELVSVDNHQGATGGGHYFAFCKDPDDKWRKYNDSHVSEISEKDIVTNNAYCLFYQKIKET